MMEEEYPRAYLYRRIVKAKIFIDQNFAEPIDIDNIAGEAHFSKFHFIRLFKKLYRKTPYRYLTSVRIEQAVNLLKSGKRVSEVCHLVGYDSLTSFSGLFRRLKGISPSDFSRYHRKIKKRIQQQPLNYIPGCFVSKNRRTEIRNFKEV